MSGLESIIRELKGKSGLAGSNEILLEFNILNPLTHLPENRSEGKILRQHLIKIQSIDDFLDAIEQFSYGADKVIVDTVLKTVRDIINNPNNHNTYEVKIEYEKGGTLYTAFHLTPTQRKLKFYLDPLAGRVSISYYDVPNQAKIIQVLGNE